MDAGGRDSFEMRSALTVCQAVYTPLQASQFDVWTMSQMNQLVIDAQALNENLRAFAVINRASTNPMVGEADEAKQLLSELDALELIKPIIRERIAYRRAVAQGKYVGELNPSDEKANQEISALYSEVFQNEA